MSDDRTAFPAPLAQRPQIPPSAHERALVLLDRAVWLAGLAAVGLAICGIWAVSALDGGDAEFAFLAAFGVTALAAAVATALSAARRWLEEDER